MNVWQWPAYSAGLAELVLVPLVLWAAVMVLATNDTQRRRLVAALFLGGTLAALWGLISWMQGEGVAADGVRRLVGPHYSPNHTALYLIRTLFVGVGLFLALLPRRGDGGMGRHKRHDVESSDAHPLDGSLQAHHLQQVGVLAGLAVVLTALVLTGSRGALLLGLPAGVITMGWLALRRRPGLLRWLRMRPGQVGAILAVLFVGMSVVIGFQWDRLANLRTVLLRADLWEAALRLWRDHLLVGVGPGGFFWNYPAYLSPAMQVEPNQLHPHNIWLEVATTWGLLGLVWLAAGLIILLRHGRTLIRLPSQAFWVVAGVSAALVAAIAHAQIDSFFLLADLAAWNAMAVAILLTTLSSRGLSTTKKT